VGLEVCLLARVAIRRVLNRLFDEERRISEQAGLAAHDRFAVLADVHGRPVGPHRPHDVYGQGRTQGLDEPAEVGVDTGRFPAGVGEDGRAGAAEVGGQVAPGSHQRQGGGLDAASEGQDDVRVAGLSHGRWAGRQSLREEGR
jgi:hypothetical protein